MDRKQIVEKNIRKCEITCFENSKYLTDEEKIKVNAYLTSASIYAYTSAFAVDRVTGEELSEFDNILSDGEFAWNVSTIHHFDKYNIKLNGEFLKKALGADYGNTDS